MVGLAKTLANELGVYNITVNNVMPGYTQTKRLENLIAKNPNLTRCAFVKNSKKSCSLNNKYSYIKLNIKQLIDEQLYTKLRNYFKAPARITG